MVAYFCNPALRRLTEAAQWAWQAVYVDTVCINEEVWVATTLSARGPSAIISSTTLKAQEDGRLGIYLKDRWVDNREKLYTVMKTVHPSPQHTGQTVWKGGCKGSDPSSGGILLQGSLGFVLGTTELIIPGPLIIQKLAVDFNLFCKIP